MPRKQNGFGSSKSFTVKSVKDDKAVNSKLTKGMKPKAAGSYPSNRTFGSTVSRTVIERYDAESDWIRWRKGYEYYINAEFERLISATPVTGSPLRNQALYIPTGKALWVTIWGISGQNATNCPIVGAQGGFY